MHIPVTQRKLEAYRSYRLCSLEVFLGNLYRKVRKGIGLVIPREYNSALDQTDIITDISYNPQILLALSLICTWLLAIHWASLLPFTL